MSTPSPQADLADIEARMTELVALAQRLSEENRTLKASQEQLSQERANLIAKNEMARSRVEAMINRLKSLEAP
jgi:cell division protein ZapB